MQNKKLNYKNPKKLKPYNNNARKHSSKQIKEIENSIKTFGFLNPVLIDENDMIIAGHGRVLAAINLQLDAIPTRLISHLSKNEKKAYILADNKLAEKAGWDDDILAIELQHLLEVDDENLIFLTGFEMSEIDNLIMLDGNTICEEDPIPSPEDFSTSEIGDIWILGKHKILCGNALNPSSYKNLLGEEKAGMIFSDPPYNVLVNGHVCGNGTIKHQEFVMASGEMSSEEFTNFLDTAFQNLVNFSRNGSIHFICMDWRHMSEILSAGSKNYQELKNLCVWNKDNGGMGSLYRSKHELVFVFKHGKAEHVNNIELGKNGRYRTNVWDYAGVNTMKSGREEELSMHPTVKPVAMIMDALLDCSNRKDIILDPFGGSGSTLIAAEKTGRPARLIELEPKYIDVTIKRWQKLTGKTAIHKKTKVTFEEINRTRKREVSNG
jgi:DNA modification methylase